MTRVVVLPSDDTACGFYRMKMPAGVVQSLRPDWQVEVYHPSTVMLGTGPDGRLWNLKGIPDPDKVDLLVMQRVSSRAQAELVRWMRSKGAAVVMDSDDAMWAIDKKNIAWKAWNAGLYHWRWMDVVAEIADVTTVTTPALARRYGKHGRTVVLPNCVPGDLRDHLTSVRGDLDPGLTVGWAGFTGTHPDDLTVVGDAVRDFQQDTDCTVRVVGDAAGAARDWGVSPENVDPVAPTPIGLPYYTALTSLDVGLVPLRDIAFNRAKSYLKALEFAAAGVIVVASPTPANVELSKTVPMELASSPVEWWQRLMDIAKATSEWRADRAHFAREAVFKHHTYEANGERWVETWERAMNRRARLGA